MCVWGGGGGGLGGRIIWSLLLIQLFVSFFRCNHIAEEERESRLLNFNCFLAVVWLLSFCVSSSWCHRLVCGLRL